MCAINSANNITVQYSCILSSCFKGGSSKCGSIDFNGVNDFPELISPNLYFFGWCYHLNKFAVRWIFLMFAEWFIEVFPALDYNFTPGAGTPISEACKYQTCSRQLCRFHYIRAGPKGEGCQSIIIQLIIYLVQWCGLWGWLTHTVFDKLWSWLGEEIRCCSWLGCCKSMCGWLGAKAKPTHTVFTILGEPIRACSWCCCLWVCAEEAASLLVVADMVPWFIGAEQTSHNWVVFRHHNSFSVFTLVFRLILIIVENFPAIYRW